MLFNQTVIHEGLENHKQTMSAFVNLEKIVAAKESTHTRLLNSNKITKANNKDLKASNSALMRDNLKLNDKITSVVQENVGYEATVVDLMQKFEDVATQSKNHDSEEVCGPHVIHHTHHTHDTHDIHQKDIY